MALITFISDFGQEDHYVAAVKAKILTINPGLNILDISHLIAPFNIAHGSFVLKSVFKKFPNGTVHLAAINSVGNLQDAYIAVKLEDHYFVGPDNGLFSLISKEDPSAVVDISGFNSQSSTFPAEQILAPAVAKLASGKDVYGLGKPMDSFKRMFGRQVKATKSQISGHVIKVDHYGNLITNIEKKVFDLLSLNKKYTITFGRETAFKINKSYYSVEPGDCFVIFNSFGLLEIGINHGNAQSLLGLDYDSPVSVIFQANDSE